MLIVDANVLISAVDRDSALHEDGRMWLAGALAAPGEAIGMPWTSLLAFVRITTNPRVYRTPQTAAEAFEIIDRWLACPRVVTPAETARHSEILRELLAKSGTAGNLVTDAHLAALCIEHEATMVSFDGDMTRFGIRCLRPGSTA